MSNLWLYNIEENLNIVANNDGPQLVIVVAENDADSDYWKKHFLSIRKDVFRHDEKTKVISIAEGSPRGNFLGMLNAWAHTKKELKKTGFPLPDIGLMSMVFGKGTRLSPFTQAMGNRKPAFVTPKRSDSSNKYLSTADISNLYANNWIYHFQNSGFRGLLLKWGDEAIIPGVVLNSDPSKFQNADAIRFAWLTEPTDRLAREKEWIEINKETGLMTNQYSRQDLQNLTKRLSMIENDSVSVGVNLGSFAISYKFLDLALEVFEEDVSDKDKSLSWDPYVWIALFCKDKSQWESVLEMEIRTGAKGIQQLESSFPNFYQKITILRDKLEFETGHAVTVPTLNFGDLLFVDFGLHRSMRESLISMTTNSEEGIALRKLFGIHSNKDQQGNIIINSDVPPSANVKNSIIVNSRIVDGNSIINQGVIIGGRHRKLNMPNGGIALFCASDYLEFKDQSGLAYRAIGNSIVIQEGGRHTTLFFPEGKEDFVTNESILNYSGQNYEQPILGNKYSFLEAYKKMMPVEQQDLEDQWFDLWCNWLD
jgi:hypothetical protein